MHEKLDQGESPDSIVAAYVRRYGAAALSVPPDEGRNRWIYGGPIVAVLVGAGFGVRLVRRWRDRGALPVETASIDAKAHKSADANRNAEYDRRVDEELRDLDD